MAPPTIPGAEFVGSEECATCHEAIVKGFATATHSRLKAQGDNAKAMGCESCHGPGSLHVQSGGERSKIVNPRKSPATCFQCHTEVRAAFDLPHHHPVLEGKVSCSDCHNPHKGDAVKGGGTSMPQSVKGGGIAMLGANGTCLQCHTAQRGPFVFEVPFPATDRRWKDFHRRRRSHHAAATRHVLVGRLPRSRARFANEHAFPLLNEALTHHRRVLRADGAELRARSARRGQQSAGE